MDQQGHILSLAIEIAEKRQRLLLELRTALTVEDTQGVMDIAKKLCGLTDEALPGNEKGHGHST